MKKDVFITIKGIQIVNGDSDVTELFTQGCFYKKNGNYYITYEESEATGFEGCQTTLKVELDKKVTLIRNGKMRSHLIIEKGARNVGHYGTEAGDLMVGVYTKLLSTNLTDNGGDIRFQYELDINNSLVSENEVFVTVKEN